MRRYTLGNICLLLLGMSAWSCEQILNIDRANLFETGVVADLNDRSATVVGLIISLEPQEPVTEYGHCWAKHTDPTIESDSLSKFGKASQTGNFASTIDNLEPNSDYFVRAYIITNGNVRYERTVSFSTQKDQNLPSLSTRSVFNISTTSAEISYEFRNLGLFEITRHGYCLSGADNPEPDLKDTGIIFRDSGSSAAQGVFFTLPIDNLQPDQTYYIRSFAVSRDAGGSESESYGNIQEFKTAK